MAFAYLKMRNDNNEITEEVVWLVEDGDYVIDAKTGEFYGKVVDLYHGEYVIVQTQDGLFGIDPKSIISIELIEMTEDEEKLMFEE